MKVLIGVLLALALAVTCERYVLAQSSKYEASIPPEILRRYDPGIVEGTRPKFVTITQPMVWGLRNQPEQGGEVYVLDCDPNRLSSVQKSVLVEWVKIGKTVLLWGEQECKKYEQLFPGLGRIREDSIKKDEKEGGVELASHPVNTDCKEVVFSTGGVRGCIIRYFTEYPAECEVIASVKDGVVAGSIPVGRGRLFFSSHSGWWDRGTDKDRWTLNLRQWMLGLPVPGATETRVGPRGAGVQADKVKANDRIVLKNGDTVSGKLVTDRFTVKTSYASLSFALKDIECVVLEGGSQNIETLVLRNGDKLSGVVGPERVKIALDSGQETEIDKEKIKEILVQR
ncbi:MAG: hypothetical protein FJW34_18430 [Acidobacteria bacterium]|nr:hypothetical protein [Acidobacteriota bacterium]